MENRRGQARRCPDRFLPPAIYISLINALYNDFRSLFVGTIAASGTALVTAYNSGEPLLYLCSLAIALVACARGLDVGRYQKRRAGILSIDEAAKCERGYVAGAAAPRHVARHVVSRCLHQDLRSVCADVQLRPDAGLYDRYLGAQFRQ